MARTVLVDSPADCRSITSQLISHDELAMDIEGVELCRNGQIGLIQLCTAAGDVYLFDIATLGHDAFANGLKDVLESTSVCKVIFDGRADADALYHIYQVQVRRPYDLQIHHALRFGNRNDRFVKGLQACLDDSRVVPIADRAHMSRIKEAGKGMFARERGGQPEVWMQRPLPASLIEYAALDVRYLLRIKELWSGPLTSVVFDMTRDRLQGAVSARAPAKGGHMSVRDFSIGPFARYLGHAAVEAPRCNICHREGHLANTCPRRARSFRGLGAGHRFDDDVVDDSYDDEDRGLFDDDY